MDALIKNTANAVCIDVEDFRALDGFWIDRYENAESRPFTVQLLGNASAGDGGGGHFYWDATSTASEDGAGSGTTKAAGTVVKLTNTTTGRFLRRDVSTVTPKQFGGKGDNSTEDTDAVSAWLDYLIANDIEGVAEKGTYLVDYISKAVNSGIKIRGQGVFKATGTNRLNMIRFTEARGKVDIDEVTFDGNEIAARPLEIQNTGSSSLGDVYIGPSCRLIKAKNTSPDSNTASGLYVFGNINDLIFSGEIDDVNSTNTSGAVSVGLFVSWSTTYWVRNTVVTSEARIRNVRNSNTVLADADGLQCLAPTSEHATLTVAPGAFFEECQGRAIKSQVVGNSIDSPVIKRSAYDGLSEIELQYAGGHVSGSRILHDGTRVNNVVSVSQRPTPDNTQCTISGNELTVTGSPSSDTGSMVATDVTNASVKLQGITIRDNKVKGTVDSVVSCRVANVVDVNRIVIDGNWAETVTTAFLKTSLYGSARAQLTALFINNGCENQATGSSITDDLIVEREFGNHNITPLLTNPFNVTIASGAVTVYGATHRIDTESSASTDDLDTINAANRSEDDWLTLRANNSARTIVLKDGTGNLDLAGDFSLDNTEDRIVLSFDGANWVELFRSDNGA